MDWNNIESDLISDIIAAKEIIKNQTGIGRPISIKEALYYDAQHLAMIGYNSYQIVCYVKFVLKALHESEESK